jgi:four helix bundle protein
VKTSNFKVQSSRKTQTQILKYPEAALESWVLNEEGNGHASNQHAFDLEERTAKFGEDIVRLSRRIPRGPSNNRIIDQLVGAGTSIGANYLEATEKVSRKDFHYTISRCVKEAKETKFFLRMLAASEPALVEEARALYREGHELHRIFASMFRKTR